MKPRPAKAICFIREGCKTVSRIVWRGMIKVDPGAQKTDGYQRNDNLMLSDASPGRLDSRPGDRGRRRPLHARRHGRPRR